MDKLRLIIGLLGDNSLEAEVMWLRGHVTQRSSEQADDIPILNRTGELS